MTSISSSVSIGYSTPSQSLASNPPPQDESTSAREQVQPPVVENAESEGPQLSQGEQQQLIEQAAQRQEAQQQASDTDTTEVTDELQTTEEQFRIASGQQSPAAVYGATEQGSSANPTIGQIIDNQV